ncbi:MAG: acetyl-CoA carboxylase biotin carboxyl carrier protein subunit [Xanthobacteraceae bacterium]|jgi:acetyl-CoA carboxylase biotin carboxyl carrier protein|nr:acetyl-CoA carboxylase biotin carboxyl carrier protein subunit [Xanthobacteraceae bacterium]
MADTKVVSEVTGSVWKVLVAVGDSVEADSPVVLIESMKMEIPVLAPDSGVVTEILVATGDPISEGQAVIALKT